MPEDSSGQASQAPLDLTFVRIPSSRWFFCRTCWRASWIFCCSFSIFTFSWSHERSKHGKVRLSTLSNSVPPMLFLTKTSFTVLQCVFKDSQASFALWNVASVGCKGNLWRMHQGVKSFHCHWYWEGGYFFSKVQLNYRAKIKWLQVNL